MTKDDERALWVLAGLWLLAKYSFDVAPALARGGAAVYDFVHDDAAHKRDLPGKQLTRQALLKIATAAGFPDPKLASAIALAESGGVPGAILRTSKEYSVGLWQINTKVHPFSVESMKDPLRNAQAALFISRGGSNWTPWSAYKSGAYKKFQTGILS